MGRRRRRKVRSSHALMASLYLAAFALLFFPSLRGNFLFRFIDKLILGATLPFQRAVFLGVSDFASAIDQYGFSIKTQRLNRRLFEENLKLKSRLESMRDVVMENMRLANLLNLQQSHPDLQLMPARVIGHGFGSSTLTLEIDRGSLHGVKPTDAVLTVAGVVGQVWKVYEKSSEVLTIMDPLSALDARVESSRAWGIFEGRGWELGELNFVKNMDEVQVGDRIVTSGMAKIFPKGWPLGMVYEVERSPHLVVQKIRVKPAVDITRVEEVTIVLLRGEKE